MNTYVWAWAGGIIGGVIGIVGGIIGTVCSIKNTKTARARSFMIKSSIVTWIALAIFLALLFALPSPYKWFMWIPYGILLPLGIVYGNKKLRELEM